MTAEPSGDRIVALDAAGDTMVTLNPVGAVVWRFLDEPRELEDVVDHLADTFPDVDPGQLRSDAEAFVAQLIEADLVHDDQA